MAGVSDSGALTKVLYEIETAPSAVKVRFELVPATVAIVLRKRVRVRDNMRGKQTNLAQL